MNLKKYQFKQSDEIDAAFPTFNTDKKLLQEAHKRGYSMNNSRKFTKIFYNGGTLVFKDGIDEEYKNKIMSFLRGFMGSFAPKHEHKAVICEMLLDEIVEEVKQA